MAANIMDILKRMQRDLADQKEYMRNLHVINRNLNEKINIMEEKISDLPKVLVTIERLEQQVKKNNMVLFGNDEIENNEDKTIMVCKPALEDGEKTNNVIEPVKVYIEEIPSDLISTERDSDKCNYKERTEELKNEIGEMKQMNKDFTLITQTSVEDAVISTFNKLDDKLNKITDLYQTDMTELREMIKESVSTNKSSVKEATSICEEKTCCSSQQLKQLSDELKVMKDMNQSDAEDIKKIMRDFMATIACYKTFTENVEQTVENENEDWLYKLCTELKRIVETNQSDTRELKGLVKDLTKVMGVKEVANTVGIQKTVQISPTFFSEAQISKLNSELKRVAETYKETNMCPIIEVKPGAAEEHSVVQQLRGGISYWNKHNNTKYTFKLGIDIESSYVINKITDYPYLTVRDVVKAWLVFTNKWDEWNEKYIFG